MLTDKIIMNSNYVILGGGESHPPWIPINNNEAANDSTDHSQRYNSINKYVLHKPHVYLIYQPNSTTHNLLFYNHEVSKWRKWS